MAIAIKGPGHYVQGPGELANLGKYVEHLGNKYMIVYSEGGKERFGDQIGRSLSNAGKQYVFKVFHGEATKNEIYSIMDECSRAGCDGVIGVGGGKAIDTAKAVAEKLGGLSCITVPTVASNDAPCSGLAVLYNENNMMVKVVRMRRSPDLVLVDTCIISKAPARLFAAGMGDALATWFEARACKRSGALTMAGGAASESITAMTRLCYDLLLQYGPEAYEGVMCGRYTEALEKVAEATIFLSGVGFESGGLAGAHAINDCLAIEPQTHVMYHGEKVAFGLLVQLVLEGAPKSDFDEVMTFMKKVGLPMNFAQLNIKEINETAMREIAEKTVSSKQFMKNISPDITAQQVREAMYRVNEIGTAFIKGKEYSI